LREAFNEQYREGIVTTYNAQQLTVYIIIPSLAYFDYLYNKRATGLNSQLRDALLSKGKITKLWVNVVE